MLDEFTVAEIIWQEVRPKFLSRMVLDSSKKIKGNENANAVTPTDSFRLLDLPGEIRNRVYRHMVTVIVSLKDLTGQKSNWFNPAILFTNHKVHFEASSITYKQHVNVKVDAVAMASYRKDLHKLPEKSRFKSCGINIDLLDARMTTACWSRL